MRSAGNRPHRSVIDIRLFETVVKALLKGAKTHIPTGTIAKHDRGLLLEPSGLR
jgi:hypothetical protein